jgi:hypothetical protein
MNAHGKPLKSAGDAAAESREEPGSRNAGLFRLPTDHSPTVGCRSTEGRATIGCCTPDGSALLDGGLWRLGGHGRNKNR